MVCLCFVLKQGWAACCEMQPLVSCPAPALITQITRHLLTDQRDPMSRAPLTPDMLVPQVGPVFCYPHCVLAWMCFE